jgi:hypothetical protein
MACKAALGTRHQHVRINQPRSFTISILAGVFFALSSINLFPLGSVAASTAALVGTFGAFWVILTYLEFIKYSRYVEIDLVKNRLSVTQRSLLFMKRTSTYNLNQFGSVISYIDFGKVPKNHIELITKAGGESVLIAYFPPSSRNSSFWSFLKEHESESGESLRKELAALLSLQDAGFKGYRMVGAQLKPKA